MDIYKVKLIENIKRTQTVESYRFAPAEKIVFQPGQFLRVMFDEKDPNNKELNKYLSFSCSPAKDYIEVTKRLSQSQFSQRLKALKIGDQLTIQAPLGKCVFKDEYKKIAFVIGGIGITPVISILEYIVEKKLVTNVLLFYSNRTEEEIAFKNELDAWMAQNSNIKIIYTVTDCPPKNKTCIFGAIDQRLLKENINDCGERTFFIFGPPRMVDSVKPLCVGINAKEVFTEGFIGY